MSKTVLITGCSSGIGKVTAEYFLQKGWNVVATMRDISDKVSQDNLLYLKLDVTNLNEIKEVFVSAINKFGSIDVVVNNAGYSLIGAFEHFTQEDIKKQFDTNVFGLINMTKEAIKYMRPQKNGTIINIASIGGRMTFPLYSLYHSSKWAVEGFSESLQHELRQFNIKIKIVEPGPIKTDFYGRSMNLVGRESNDYKDFVNGAVSVMTSSGNNGAYPIVVARTIYKAAKSKGFKLRYAPDLGAKVILFLRWLLPDVVFNNLIRLMIAGK